jgi:FkbM family methyltransferase
MTVVDLGANIGYYSVIASKLVGTSGRVFAFEAHPLVFDYLRRNLEINDCDNVVAVERAASDLVASSPFVLNGLEGGFLTRSVTNEDHVVVQTTTLDAFFAEQAWPSVDLVKIDIEGAETAALTGMKVLSERNPQLKAIIEINSGSMQRSGLNSLALTGILRDLGFCKAYVIEQAMKEISFADSRWHSPLLFNFLLVK